MNVHGALAAVVMACIALPAVAAAAVFFGTLRERRREHQVRVDRLKKLADDNRDKFARNGIDIVVDDKTDPIKLRLVRKEQR